jgi:Acetyltransferase (GNAT) domain
LGSGLALISAFSLQPCFVDCGLLPVDPCDHASWDSLLEARGDASIFHTRGWAQVLKESYCHRPFYFCRIEDGRLKELLPVMEVSSRWTGRRGVSLPFTDFTTPLREQGLGAERLYSAAVEVGRERGWRYFECRGNHSAWTGSLSSLKFYGHAVDLSDGPDALFQGLEGSVRRGIRKAQDSKVAVEYDSTPEGIKVFYRLHCGTRRRHGVPPQPFRFFENIARYILGQKRGFVAIARHEDKPIAAAVFFHFAREAIYKFGASDMSFQHLRPNNLVMWSAIKRLAEQGMSVLHLGRTSLANEGLRRFKLGFGAREEEITYSKFSFRANSFVRDIDRAEGWPNHLFRLLPAPAFRWAGSILYPHLS